MCLRFKVLNFLLVGILLGVMNSYIYHHKQNRIFDRSDYCGIVTGVVSDIVVLRNSSQQIDLKNVFLYKDKNPILLHEGIRLLAPLFPIVKMGDAVEFYGCLSKSEIEHYQNLLESDGIYYVSIVRSVSIITNNRDFFSVIKGQIVKSIEEYFCEPYSSMLLGMSWGIKRLRGTHLEQNIQLAGISYLFSVSGYHIIQLNSFLRSVLLKVFKRFGIIVGSTLLILIYSIFVNSGVSFGRALLMLVLLQISEILGRVPIKELLVVFVVSLLLISKPYIYKLVGFQLSILATVGILLLPSLLDKYLSKFKYILSIPLSAQLAVFPLLVCSFGGFSILSLPLGIFITLFLPIIVVLGILFPFLSLVSVLGGIIFWVTYPFLFFIELVLSGVTKIPSLFVEFNINIVIVCGYYLLLILLYTFFNELDYF